LLFQRKVGKQDVRTLAASTMSTYSQVTYTTSVPLRICGNFNN
jgi:hypothetical protein